jgi:polyphosphate kinase
MRIPVHPVPTMRSVFLSVSPLLACFPAKVPDCAEKWDIDLLACPAAPVEDYGPLLVAPHNMRERFTEVIRREGDHQRAGRPSGIRAKVNQLQDPEIVRDLYEASRAGVPITLCVRGLCCLRAGVPGLSPAIRVFSILGRFLEHSRIYRFENAGHPEFYLGSADWMRRNFNNRMETVAPVTDPAIQADPAACS